MPGTRAFLLCTQHLNSARLQRLAIECLLLAFIFLAVGSLHYRQHGGMSPQSLANIAAAEKPTLIRAVAEYPKCWPPVYPASLWIFSNLGGPIRVFNLLCFYGVLLTAGAFTRRYYPGVAPNVVVVFIAVLHANYCNLHQQTSEALLLLLAALTLLLLGSFKERSSLVVACSLGVLTAAAVLTRFFALFWIAPVAFAHLTVFSSVRSWQKRLSHAFAYTTPIVLIAVPWLLYLYISTGSFSGLDRSGPRNYPPDKAHWSDLTGFTVNVEFAMKTTLIDLFSPDRTSQHPVVNTRKWTTPEIFVAGALVLLVTLVLVGAVQVFRNLPALSKHAVLTNLLKAPPYLPFHFVVVYVLAMIALWTLSNNDPIYTRFMFPSYVFLVLTTFAFFAWLRAHVNSAWGLVPSYLLGALFVGSNLTNIGSWLTDAGSIFR
jgi:hypothetical protein